MVDDCFTICIFKKPKALWVQKRLAARPPGHGFRARQRGEYVTYSQLKGVSFGSCINNQKFMQTHPEYSKFKWLFPSTLVLVVLISILGPYLFPHALNFLFRCLLVFGTLHITYMVVCSIRALYISVKVPIRQPEECQTDVTYAWVIPNYNEEDSIINQTLMHIASHTRAKNNYAVFLAMEAHEINAKEKACRITENFKSSFRHIGYSIHPLAPGEAKGKAANVSYCVEHFSEIMPADVDLDKVFVTVMDCDGLAPNQYIDQVNARIYKNREKSEKTTFGPSQIFTRNDREVPVHTRSFDYFHSMAHWSLYIIGTEFTLPLSNYTISYKALKKIGFWDKYTEAIAEDSHTTLKAYFQTGGDHYGEQIYVPFNQLNVQSGDRYFENLYHKFWQAVRHAQGLAEACYTLQKYTELKSKSLRSNIILLFLIDSFYFMPIIISGFSISNVIQVAFGRVTEKIHYDFIYSGIQEYILLCNLACMILHHLFSMYTAKRYFNKTDIPFWRFIEYYAFVIGGLHGILIPSMAISIIKGMLKSFEYNVAPKVGTQDKSRESTLITSS